MSPLRVLHFRNCRGISTITGPETRLLTLFRHVDPWAYELHLLCLLNPRGPRPVFDEHLWRQIVGDRHHLHLLRMSRAWSPRDLFALRTLIRTARIQVVATHDARSNVIGLPLARILGRPSLAFAHGWVNWTRRLSKQRLYAAMEARAIRWADRIVVASQAMTRDLARRGIPTERIRHIPHGIDTERFRPASEDDAFRRELGIASDTPLIGTVGRLHPWKGQRHFLEAAALITRRRPAARFVVVGDITSTAEERYRWEILRLADALGLGERCYFPGTRTDIPSVMRALDVFVLSSIREPFGWVLLEAQACGTPVVSFAVDGTPEALQDGTGGVLVPAPDSQALADAVLRLLDDPAARHAMATAGREWVHAHFSLEAMVQRTEALYREVLDVAR